MSLLRKFPEDNRLDFDPESEQEVKIEQRTTSSMPQTAVSEIIQRAQQVYLNDISGSTYTTTILMPFVKDAYEDFQLELEINNVSCKSTTETRVISAGVGRYLPLPQLFVWPDKMEERKSGATNDSFTPMLQRDFELNVIPTRSTLGFWCFRDDGIYFPGATEDRDVTLYYKKAFPEINDDSDIVFGRAKNYLAAKASAMALHLIAQNNTLANSCNDRAQEQLNKIVRLYQKMDQGIPYRGIPFRSYGW